LSRICDRIILLLTELKRREPLFSLEKTYAIISEKEIFMPPKKTSSSSQLLTVEEAFAEISSEAEAVIQDFQVVTAPPRTKEEAAKRGRAEDTDKESAITAEVLENSEVQKLKLQLEMANNEIDTLKRSQGSGLTPSDIASMAATRSGGTTSKILKNAYSERTLGSMQGNVRVMPLFTEVYINGQQVISLTKGKPLELPASMAARLVQHRIVALL